MARGWLRASSWLRSSSRSFPSRSRRSGPSRGIGSRSSSLARQLPGPVDPEALFESREISRIGEAHWLDGDRTWQRRFERFAQLQGRADARTVGLYLRPL